MQQDGAPSHTARNTETCSLRTCSSVSRTFSHRIARIWTRLTCHLGCSSADGLPSSKFLLSWERDCQNHGRSCYHTAQSLPFITFIIFLFTVNVISQMAPPLSKVDSNKLLCDIQNVHTVICAKFGKDLFNISEVIGRKTRWSRFFGLPCTLYVYTFRKIDCKFTVFFSIRMRMYFHCLIYAIVITFLFYQYYHRRYTLFV